MSPQPSVPEPLSVALPSIVEEIRWRCFPIVPVFIAVRVWLTQGCLSPDKKTESIAWLDADSEAPESATSLVGDMQLLIPLAGLIDKQAELDRLQKNIGKLEQEVERIKVKLANENFVSRAPASVVDKEKERLVEAESALGSLRGQAERISAI